MKKRLLLLGLIFVILGLRAQSQIVVTYQQGFEATGENSSYTVQSGTVAATNSLAFSGGRSLKMSHTTTDAVIVLDTIDFTANGSFQYFSMEFNHINNVDPTTCQTASICAIIEAKRADQTTFTKLNGTTHYDKNGEYYSSDFAGTDSYSRKSYAAWLSAQNNVTNADWKKEKFNLNTFFTGTAQSSRKLIVRITLKARTSGTSTQAWYLDNLVFKASTQAMVNPKINMLNYPDLGSYPTSRSTRIEANVSTSVQQGLNLDSVYMLYRLGVGAPIQKQTLQVVSQQTNNQGGVSNARVKGTIPFVGYDTTISYRIVVQDATLNKNQVNFPADAASWNTYHNVRGTTNQQSVATALGATLNNIGDFPFPTEASHRSQFIYDSASLAAAGYKPGAITSMTFTAASSVSNSRRDTLEIKMCNVPTDYTIDQTSITPYFNLNAMKVVYDSVLVLTQNANTTVNIYFQDTFFYAGKDLMMMVTSASYNNTGTMRDPGSMQVKGFATASQKQTLYQTTDARTSMNPWTKSHFEKGITSTKRPDFTFRAYENLPLIYDCGISGYAFPNDSTPATANQNNNVTLTLKNYGVSTINAVTLYYQVDGGVTHSYNWTGSLAGGATTNVTVSTTENFSVGYHEMLAWVDDSVTSNGVHYRDHEPYNDTLWTKLVACAGPFSGNIQVGGTGADYQTLERFLYAVSQCGVGGPLHVKLAPNTYEPIVIPNIPGASATNFVQFEPLNGQANSVVFNQGTTSSSILIDLRNTHHIRFSKIKFQSAYLNNVTYPVRMGINSIGCQFSECTFEETASNVASLAASTRATALLYSGGADSLEVRGCTFKRGNVGVSMVGPAADNLAHGAVICNNSFQNQGSNAIIVRNHVSSIVDSNSVDNILTNTSYALLFQDCHDAMRVTRNTVYVTSGASCLGVTGFLGTNSNNAIIANNMLISNDDGQSNMLTTPMFIIDASYTKVLHNSIKLNAPQRSGVAAATFGGGEIDHCYFYNNIVASTDQSNYAFSYVPYEDNINYIGFNIYYSGSFLLNKYDGVNCNNLTAWRTHINDANSQNTNPAFLSSTPTDLRSYSQQVKNHAFYFADVPTDIYGTQRDNVSPCVGAFEFLALPYDFEIVGMVEPYDEYCDVPASGAPLRLQIKNSGINTFIPGNGSSLNLTYSRATTPGQMTPGQSGIVQILDTIPGSSTRTCTVNATLNFPTNGMLDTTYRFYFWLTSAIDPNPINDTSSYTVTAHYHAPAPSNVNVNANYGSSATVNVTSGVQQWYSNIYTSGRAERSTIYWYTDNDPNTVPFYRGNSYTTDVLYHDTTFYIRQHRNLPLMKITEVQLKNNGVGVTFPQQLWMNAATAFAVEMTNVGDYPAELEGDTLMLCSVNTNNNNAFATLNNKMYIFPRVTIQPGKSLVVQFRSGITTTDSTKTLGAGATITPAYNHNFAILYRDKRGVVDAVSFNNMSSASGTVWTQNNIHNSVWAGQGIALNNTTAGVIRKGWPTSSSSPSNSAQYWQVADSTHIMTLGTPDTKLIRFYDNGCLGEVATVNIHLNNLPSIDLSLDSISMPEGCGLANENVVVNISNYGAQASGQFVARYSINGVVACTDTLASLAPRAMVTHTFSTPANMFVSSGETRFDFKVWVDHVNGDNTYHNDTSSCSVVSRYTPAAPVIYPYDTVNYAERAVLTTDMPSADSLAWYDRNMRPLDTTNVFTSDFLYTDDTFYVTAFGPAYNNIHLGELSMVNGATAYPSPYNPNKVNGQEQYLIKAEEMIAAGHSAGPIKALSFYLDTIRNATGSMTFNTYKVSIGSTSIEAFNGGAASTRWQTLTEVYNQTNLTLTNADRGWITHEFTTPFVWDGTSNIVVGITRSLSSAISQGAQTRYTQAFAGSVYYKDDANAATLTNVPGNGTLSDKRPDMLFRFQDYGCEGPASPVYVHVEGTPASDASLQWPVSMDTTQFSSCGASNFNVSLFNGGSSALNSLTIDYWVDATHGVYNNTTTIASGQSSELTIATPSLTPGRHTLLAIVNAPNDTVPVNDTIRRMINVSFCGGTYTIGPAAGNDYPSFQVALDTLYGAGISGPVVFDVQSGIYNEQLNIAAIEGTSTLNTVTFRSANLNRESVTLRHAPTAAENYVLKLDGGSNVIFDHMTIYSNGPAASSNAVWLTNCSNIHFNNAVIRVKGTTNNANSSCVLVYPGVHELYIENSRIDSGYYAIRSMCADTGLSANMFINSDTIDGFWSTGIQMRKVNGIYIRQNYIHSGVSVAGRALTGILVANVEGGIDIERNYVILADTKNGGKRPISVFSCIGNDIDRGKIYNNMCSSISTGTTGQVPYGISIDSSQFMNVYYNTVSLNAGANAATTRSFSVDHNSAGIYVLNNIFANFSKGYAYWLNSLSNVSSSNYNVIFSDTAAATRKLARIGTAELTSIDTLRIFTQGREANSMFSQPTFVSGQDLHLAFGTYNEKAQYLPEVTTDIDGESRPAIPAPCIGADEFGRSIHDVGIMQFITPTLAANTVEADTLFVKVKLMNNGTSTETNLWWNAEIIDHPTLRTLTRTIAEMQPGEIIYDSSFIVLPMGLIDTQYIRAYFSTDLHNDSLMVNNVTDTVFFIEMAYDLTVATVNDVNVTTEVGFGEGCRLNNAPISLTVTNKGRKPVPVDYPLTIGYEVKLPTSATYTVAQIPLTHTEEVYLNAPLGVNESREIPFANGVNLYPTGNSKDISVRVRGWVSYQFDQKPVGPNSKDTSAAYTTANSVNSWKTVTSKYLPTPPNGVDLHIPYATWDTIHASQNETLPGTTASRPIMWYRDSTDAEPFHAPTQYARSCWWETPQYFHDSTYYLACVSNTGCTSYYNPVHVYLNPRVAVDAAIVAVEEPYSKVYMDNDTVKVRIINYGNQPLTNIPVTYQLRRQGNNMPVLQEVTEICRATIAPDDTYLFKFDSLIILPTENVNYTLRTWTDLGNEMVRVNDTLRDFHVFKTLPESQYTTPVVGSPGGLDITRISFSSLNSVLPEVGRDYSNFAQINNPMVEKLRLIKGTTDTMILEVANSDDHADFNTGGFLTVMIDYNRDGHFDNTDPEMALYGDYTEIIFADTISSRHPRKFIFTVPDSICLGHMRMRAVLAQGGHEIFEYGDDNALNIDFGNVQDYLLYIEDNPVETDAALSRLVSPTTPFVESDSTSVSIMISNKGATPITSAEIAYSVIHGSLSHETYNWTGNILPGHSEAVTLPARHLEEGTTTYKIAVNVYGDTNATNDSLTCQFHRFQVKTLVLTDDFESDQITWYAPQGFTSFTENVWQKGTPAKRNLNSWVSDSTVYATQINGSTAYTQRGNLSYLYTPIIDISQIRPDTISFYIARDLGDSSFVYLEYFDWQGKWRKVGTANDTLWYNAGAGFAGTSAGYAYERRQFATRAISGEFQQRLQFRFVFVAHPGAPVCDGVTIDDFTVGRAQRAVDVGVIAITSPTHPKFGQTIYPKVVIKNFGYDTMRSVNLAYRPYGSNLAKTGTYNGVLEPGGTALYTFPDPFVVMSDFPDTFEICAYTTVNMDIYWENDSTCKNFGLAPLDNDMGMVEFLYPLSRIVAGDSIVVTTRMRNYGQAPVDECDVTYVYNNFEVTEHVDFNAILNRPLGSFEFFNYTFRQKCRASMGTMHLKAIVNSATDDYIYNDTINKTLQGISAITDLKAKEIVIDTSLGTQNICHVQLTVENIGARAVSDMVVGFWHDRDTSTMYYDTIHLDPPLASLHTYYHTFDTVLAARTWPNSYQYVNAFVLCANDNDHTNDTTDVIATQFVDITPHMVLIEENRNEECRVRIQIENVGNTVFNRNAGFYVGAVINGVNLRKQTPNYIAAGRVYHIEFNTTIPKDPNRNYTGYGYIDFGGDANHDNDQTTRIEIQNYFDDIPLVPAANGMTLEQNYPNPFDANTRIDFNIPTSGNVRFFVMDVMGRLVYQSDDQYEAGNNSINFSQSDLSTGVYYYGIEMDGNRLMRKMVYKK